MPENLKVPIVDLAGGRAGIELAAACSTPGSFYILNHGIPQSVIDAAFSASRRFFAQPDDAKMALHTRKCPPYRGYVRLQERKKGSGLLVDDPMEGDLKENFDLGPALPADDRAVGPDSPFYGPNVWPSEPTDFRDAIETYTRELKSLAFRLLSAIEVGLSVEPGTFTRNFDRPLTRMKLIHYPPAPATSGEMPEGVGAHTDFSCLTILAQDNVGGLEIFDRSGGRPIPAPPVPGSLFINVGDQFARWTNDRFWPTVHRVVNAAPTDRYSIAFFLHPNFDAIISCPSQCVGPSEVVKYPPVVAGKDLLARLTGAYDRPHVTPSA